MGGLEKGRWGVVSQKRCCLTAESVQGTSLAFQSVDDVHGGDGLSLGVLGVGDGITDDVLKENLQDTTGLFVDEARDTLDTTTTSQTTDSGLGDTLDVITQHLAMTLGASLSQTFSSFATSRHDYQLNDAEFRKLLSIYPARGRLISLTCKPDYTVVSSRPDNKLPVPGQ